MNPYDKFVDAAKDHYWNSLEMHRDLIMKHIEEIANILRDNSAIKDRYIVFECKMCGADVWSDQKASCPHSNR